MNVPILPLVDSTTNILFSHGARKRILWDETSDYFHPYFTSGYSFTFKSHAKFHLSNSHYRTATLIFLLDAVQDSYDGIKFKTRNRLGIWQLNWNSDFLCPGGNSKMNTEFKFLPAAQAVGYRSYCVPWHGSKSDLYKKIVLRTIASAQPWFPAPWL